MSNQKDSSPFNGLFHGLGTTAFVAVLVILACGVLLLLGKSFCVYNYLFCVEGEDLQAKPTVEAAGAQPTSVPITNGDNTPAQVTKAPSVNYPQRFISRGGVPESSTMDILVNQGEVHVLTSGPVCVAGTCLLGGESHGSVVIFLPSDTHYTVSGLIPGQNWYGAYYASQDMWQIIATDLVSAMKRPGNCTNGTACAVVDLLVVGRDGVVIQEEK